MTVCIIPLNTCVTKRCQIVIFSTSSEDVCCYNILSLTYNEPFNVKTTWTLRGKPQDETLTNGRISRSHNASITQKPLHEGRHCMLACVCRDSASLIMPYHTLLFLFRDFMLSISI